MSGSEDVQVRRDDAAGRFEILVDGVVAGAGGSLGTGGMASKLAAARLAADAGIPVLLTSAERAAEALAAEPTVVSEMMTLDPLMRLLRQTDLQMAVVVDEFGGTAGIVTLEDLEGSIECLFFPMTYLTVQTMLTQDVVADLLVERRPEPRRASVLHAGRARVARR